MDINGIHFTSPRQLTSRGCAEFHDKYSGSHPVLKRVLEPSEACSRLGEESEVCAIRTDYYTDYQLRYTQFFSNLTKLIYFKIEITIIIVLIIVIQ